jgi:hypothetical protein
MTDLNSHALADVVVDTTDENSAAITVSPPKAIASVDGSGFVEVAYAIVTNFLGTLRWEYSPFATAKL